MNMKKKHRLNKKGLIIVILSLYLIIMCFYYVFNLDIKSIDIRGNNLVTDEEIIALANIDSNTKILNLSKNSLIKKIKNNKLIKSVSIKRRLNGSIIITISEYNILFYDLLNNEYVLDNNEKIAYNNEYLGIPTLTNQVSSEILDNLVKKMSKVNIDIIYLISEITYDPSIKNDVVMDEYRFLLKMNDGNTVYINLANFSNLEKYEDYFDTLDEGVKGILYLDSSSTNGILFKSYESIAKEEVSDEG